jgi:hypothetical protein
MMMRTTKIDNRSGTSSYVIRSLFSEDGVSEVMHNLSRWFGYAALAGTVGLIALLILA